MLYLGYLTEIWSAGGDSNPYPITGADFKSAAATITPPADFLFKEFHYILIQSNEYLCAEIECAPMPLSIIYIISFSIYKWSIDCNDSTNNTIIDAAICRSEQIVWSEIFNLEWFDCLRSAHVSLYTMGRISQAISAKIIIEVLHNNNNNGIRNNNNLYMYGVYEFLNNNLIVGLIL